MDGTIKHFIGAFVLSPHQVYIDSGSTPNIAFDPSVDTLYGELQRSPTGTAAAPVQIQIDNPIVDLPNGGQASKYVMIVDFAVSVNVSIQVRTKTAVSRRKLAQRCKSTKYRPYKKNDTFI